MERSFGIAELLKIFLLPNEIYRNEEISPIFRKIARSLLPCNANQPIDFFLVNVMGLDNLLLELVEEYAATSYGDPLFSQFLLLFLRMDQPSTYRKMIWRELGSPFLNFLQPNSSFYSFVDEKEEKDFVKIYFYPIEIDYELLQIYSATLREKENLQLTNPFLHQILVHHLTLHLFNDFPFKIEQEFALSDWQRKQLLLDISLVSFFLY